MNTMDDLFNILKGANPEASDADLNAALANLSPDSNLAIPPMPPSSFDVRESTSPVVQGGSTPAMPAPSTPLPPLPPTPDSLALPSAPVTAPVAPPMPPVAPKAVKPTLSTPAKSVEPPLAPTGPSDDEKQRLAAQTDAEKKRKLAIIPGAIAGIGDAIASGASAFGVNAPTGRQEKIMDKADVAFKESGQLADTKIKNDPNSDISKAYRQMVLQIVPDMAKQPAFQNMSAQAIGDRLPLIDTMMRAQAQKDAKELGMKQLQDNKNLSIGLKDEQQQDKLEKEGRDMINKVVSTRSGGLGLEDQKVNQAIHLQAMLNDAYDPKTKTYTIPPSMHTELAIGLQRLLSPTGAGSQQLTEELRQKTAREGLAGALIYMGFDPKEVGGTTQSVSKFFANAVKRQGLTSEQNRDTYIQQFKNRMPTRLSEERKNYLINQEVGNSYSKTLPEHQKESAKPKLEKDSLGLF